MPNKEHTSYRQKSGVLAIKEHWCLSEDTRTGIRRLLKLIQTEQTLQKVLEHFGYWILVLGSNVLDVPQVSAHHRGPHQHLH